jgi:hypothetical protein
MDVLFPFWYSFDINSLEIDMNAYDRTRVTELMSQREYLLELIEKARDDSTNWELICERHHKGDNGSWDLGRDVVTAVLGAELSLLDERITAYGVAP